MRRRLAFVVVSALATTVALGACAYDWTFYGPGGGDGGAEAGDAFARDGAGREELPPPVPPGPPPVPGECDMTQPCPQGFYCDFPSNDCGGTGEKGTCKAVAPCPAPSFNEYVCGCDGVVYKGGACEASQKGADVAADGRCVMNDSTLFRCGYRFCLKATQLCQVSKGSITEYKCVPLCPKADCTCATSCSACSGAADGGGITAICP